MKIAVPTRGNVVDDHFGHCETYTVFTIGENNTIKHEEILPSPQGCGCKSNIASVLKAMGVNVMLAGNMGTGALNVLQNQNIRVYRGCSGNVRLLVANFLHGKIGDSGETCKSHDHQSEDHICNH